MKKRGFEIAKGWEDKEINLPQRSTQFAAGYDIEAAADIIVPAFKPGTKPTLIPTGLKADCLADECLYVVNRSSGPKRGLVVANGIGIVDADYYNNPENDGHFQVLMFNVGEKDLKIKKGERVAQVIFQKYLLVDGDFNDSSDAGAVGSRNEKMSKKARAGGFGSTGFEQSRG